jgi:amino acid adenylation domain-containing protein
MNAPETSEVFAFPMSFAQQRLWLLDQLESNNSFYNTPNALVLSGPLHTLLLEKALNEIVRRHEILRTIFTTQSGQPVQVILPALTLAVPVVELRSMSALERHREVREQALEEAQRPFDLAKGPLLRGSLFRLAPTEHVLLLTIHHIIWDGWSIGVFVRELNEIYQAFLTGAPSPLPDLSIQYADFTCWQREWLQGDVLANLARYWKQQLAGNLSILNLPTDRPRPPVQSFRGRAEHFIVARDLSRRLSALGQSAGATPFMTLLSAFGVLLHRYTDQKDILVGSPIANRNRSELESLIGCFVNTLVLRMDLSEDPPFSELLKKVRATALDAYAHQDLPFEQLVEMLQPDRNLNQAPLVQTMFVLQNAPLATLELPGLSIAPFELERGTTQFDLTLLLTETTEGLQGTFEYNTDLFERGTIQRMICHYRNLLEAITENPSQRVGELPMLAESERQQLLVEWNRTERDYPRERCLAGLFEDQVEKNPEAVAVVFGDQTLSYGELNQRANRLGHYLQSLSVGPEVLVGICVERSLEMVVGLLGILKAGGAYLPLDPGCPKERLAFMLADAKVKVLLTQEKLISTTAQLPAQIICLDRDWANAARMPLENVVSEASPENLAYISYTSGSTGRPKGVAITHRNVVRLVKNTNFAELTPDQTFLQLAPISFDASTLEIWGSLLNGARLVVMPPHAPSLAELGSTLRQHQVTTLWLTAGLFQLMVDEQLSSLQTLRQLLAGGDVLSAPHVRKVLQGIGPNRLINGYGPTENTTFTCCYSMTATTEIESSVPIGRPVANTEVFVLDSHLQLTPVGVPGELFAAGAGLARGYLNRPELTAERFIPHPFSAVPGACLYRTGDRARYHPDGNIEFLGRVDHQVKLRGFRIELGEIEQVLGLHPNVREALVILREDAVSPGPIESGKQLVAYVVLGAKPAFAMSELRQFLSEKLADYMVPSAFVALAALPLNANGKVDRTALPAPDRSSAADGFVAPRTPIEEQIAAVWRKVLGWDRVGIHDNFFELGGHSLMATQVASRLPESFGVQLPLRVLFEKPTVAQLAEWVAARQAEQKESELLEQILTEVDELSDDEVNEQLSMKEPHDESGKTA